MIINGAPNWEYLNPGTICHSNHLAFNTPETSPHTSKKLTVTRNGLAENTEITKHCQRVFQLLTHDPSLWIP